MTAELAFDVVIAGAGVVGLACARVLACAGRSVLVLEAEAAVGQHTSSRSSEVIHAGLYYPPGSLKARLCVRGRALLYDYCARRGVATRRVGKLIVATEPAELAELARIRSRAEASDVHDLRDVDTRELAALEPHVTAHGALLSPSTGIVDSHGLMAALRADAVAAGAWLRLGTRVSAVEPCSAGFDVRYESADERGRLRCRSFVNAAGLFAPALARSIAGLDPARLPTAHFAKGHYFTLRGPSPFSRLIYPVPVAHGLGVHVTLDLGGRVRFGPDVSFCPQLDYTFEDDETRVEAFVSGIRRYFPAITRDALSPGYVGVRPKLGPAHEPARDFVVETEREHGLPGLVQLFGIESPGLTASLALAELVAGALAE